MITYRMQDQSRSLNDLLDPEQQHSFPMGGQDEAVRHGVSGIDRHDGQVGGELGDTGLHWEQGVEFDELRSIADDRYYR